jgi:hypothetical protein
MAWVPKEQIPAAGTTSAAGFPWAIVVPIALSLLTQTGLLGETTTQRQRRLMNELLKFIQPQQQYFASRFKEYDPAVAQALMNQLKMTRGWGWPTEMGGG